MSESDADGSFDPGNQATQLLYSHILEKGWQAGAIIGVGIVAPIVAIRYKRNVSKGIAQDAVLSMKLLRAVGTTTLIGTALSGAMGAFKIRGIDDEGIRDRAYRLHYNEGQNRTDKFARAGGVPLAFAAAAYSWKFGGPKASVLTPIAGGMAIGTAAGVLVHLATSEKEEGPNKMLKEVKE